DTYTIKARTDQVGITAILLEALPDTSLPHGGSGRANENGNCALSDFTVLVQPTNAKDKEQAVQWQTAVTDHQVIRADHTNTQHALISQATEGNPLTSWETGPRSRQPHYAVFVPVQPIGQKGGATLTIKLAFQSLNNHNLGRFRLSLTTQPQPLQWPTI